MQQSAGIRLLELPDERGAVQTLLLHVGATGQDNTLVIVDLREQSNFTLVKYSRDLLQVW